MAHPSELQERIGMRVRRRRGELGLTLQALADRAGLSARFLSDVESGKSNVSIQRLDAVARELELPLCTLVQPARTDRRAAIDAVLDRCSDDELVAVRRLVELALGRGVPPVVALLGVRGAGKSTVGRQLAAELGLPFVELAERVERRAGMPIGEVFTTHGETFYRELELAALQHLIREATPCVVALPGGIVTSQAAMELIRETCTSVWLRAEADDYFRRVFAQGDTRPMEGRADAMADLQRLIERRRPLYAQADLVADTSGNSPEQVTRQIAAELEQRGLRP